LYAIFVRKLFLDMSKEKRLFINGRFLNQRVSGVQRFAIETTKEISKNKGIEVVLICSNRMKVNNELKSIKKIRVGFFWGHWWEQIELPLYLIFRKRPLLLNLTNSAPVMYFNKIYTLLDTSFKDIPKSFSWKFRIIYKALAPMCLKTSRKVVTISQFSKSRILTNYKFVNKDQISVVYCGIKKLKPKKKPPRENIILSVASLDPRKNTKTLIEAFNLFNKDNKYKLILVGRAGKAFDHKGQLQENKNVIYETDISDDELALLYSKAKLYVSLSKYEGFGLPIIEALLHKTPVLCSEIEVFKELFTGYVNFTETDSIKKIAENFKTAMGSNIFTESKSINLQKKYNWEKTAKGILEASGIINL